jgi:hypothetical protein
VKSANSQLLSRQLPHQASEGGKFSEPPSTWAAFRCSNSQAPPTNFRYRSAEHWIEISTNYYGPLHKAYAAVGADRRGKLIGNISGLLARRNVGGAKSLVAPGEYLEIVITKD